MSNSKPQSSSTDFRAAMLLDGALAASQSECLVLLELLGEGLVIGSDDESSSPVSLSSARFDRAFQALTPRVLNHLIDSPFCLGLYPLGVDGALRYAIRPRS